MTLKIYDGALEGSGWNVVIINGLLARHQILQVPVVPDATAYLQTLDTHCFASLKASLRRAKAHVNELEEAGFTQLGQAYAPQLGPSPAIQRYPRGLGGPAAQNPDVQVDPVSRRGEPAVDLPPRRHGQADPC